MSRNGTEQKEKPLLTNSPRKFTRRIIITGIVAATVWTALISGFLTWNITHLQDMGREFAEIKAKALFRKDVIYRRWNALHEAVYVPVTETTEPNPYLDVENRDVETTDGQKLTMINPAYMTRQALEIQSESENVYGHITSLNPIRPANSPDPWEEEALRIIEERREDVSSITTVNGTEYLRLMSPLITEESCLKCHAKQGYEVGNIRGGISVSVPYAPYRETMHRDISRFSMFYSVLWVLGMAGIGFIFFRLRKHEQSRNESMIRLAAANRAKDDFLANMSHEIRTPLNGIIGIAETMKLENRQESESVRIIKNSAEGLLSIIQDILDFSKLEARRITLEETDFNLLELIADTAALFRHTAEEKGIGLKVETDKDLLHLFPVLRGDKGKIKQIIMNLLSNSIKFTDAGSVTVTADIVKQTDTSALIRILVADTGIGIEPEVQTTVFEKFYTVDMTSSRKHGGSGLGLTISRQLALILGGDLLFSSLPGEGTVFRILLPLTIPPRKDPSKETAADQKGTITIRRVLLVEDNKINQRVAEKLFASFGLETDIASDGTVGVAKFRQGGYDAVFMDLVMPEMDGFETTRRIRSIEKEEQRKPVPIIAMSATVIESERQKAFDAGVDRFLPKPVKAEELRKVLTELDSFS